MSKKSYSQKLRDPRWQKRRLEILNRDDFRCQVCGAEDQTLHVHHRRYQSDPWESPDEDLETLCETCHSRINDIPPHSLKFVRESIDRPLRAADVLAAAELSLERYIEKDCGGDIEAMEDRDDFWKIDFLFYINLKHFA